MDWLARLIEKLSRNLWKESGDNDAFSHQSVRKDRKDEEKMLPGDNPIKKFSLTKY